MSAARRGADVETAPEDRPVERRPAGAPSGRFLVTAVAAALLLSFVAGMLVSIPPAADADVHVFPDRDAAVVLCVVDAHGSARCHGKDEVLAGMVDGSSPAICGMADRPLLSPCPAGRACVFRQAAAPSGPVGLVLLEPHAPLFGVPRHRLVDAAVLAPAAAAPRIAAGVESLARCFAPADAAQDWPAIEPSLGACEARACRLRHSSVRIAPGRSAAASHPDTPWRTTP